MKLQLIFSAIVIASLFSCSDQNQKKMSTQRPAFNVEQLASSNESYVDDDKPPSKQTCKSCTKTWSGKYINSKGEKYTICKDQDGYLVTDESDGSTDAHGTGFSWTNVKEQYELNGVSAYDCDCGGEC